MYIQPESFEREPALARIASMLPAATYNNTRILLAASGSGCVFVPIRAMQYLAVVDAEEIIFVDSQHKRWVEVAWRGFKPQSRSALDEPVAYEAVFYTPDAGDTQRRLQAEFPAALTLLAGRRQPSAPAHILSLARRPATNAE
ncbi:MAG: hypothetical protein B7Y41_03480 [Hydrogenophilales bacterium 28-61-23]|nr:MAG: hypothetical protein B7Y41_03480 [Hydrogenophilales bacterium 28-61-23]